MPFESPTLAPAATITFLFTDIEGSTRLLQEIGTGYPAVLEEHTKLLQSALEARGGRVVDRAGDGLFVAFESAGGAMLGAVEGQRALLEHAWPAGVRVHVRMGLHTGEAVRSGSSWVGLDVHRAAPATPTASHRRTAVVTVRRPA
jgi:class 3 adenylate cyclase